MAHSVHCKNARDIKAAAFQPPLPGGSTLRVLLRLPPQGSGVATRSEDRPRGSRQRRGPSSERLEGSSPAPPVHTWNSRGAGRRGTGFRISPPPPAIPYSSAARTPGAAPRHLPGPLTRKLPVCSPTPAERAERSRSTFVLASVGCLGISHFGERSPPSSNLPSVYCIP